MAKAKVNAAETVEGLAEEKKQELAKEVAPELRAKYEEDALRRVAKAMGIPYDEILEKEAKKAVERKIALDIGTNVVHINGEAFSGKMVVEEGVADTIRHMVGARNMRLLEEVTQKNYEVIKSVQGGISSRVVAVVDPGQGV